MPKSKSSDSRERPVKRTKLDSKANLTSKLKSVKFPAGATNVSVSVESHSNKQNVPPSHDSNPGSEKEPTLSSFKIIAGSYEKLLYGLEGFVTSSPSGYSYSLKPIFIFPAHVSCIKAVAASPNGAKWLATGSADEIVKVWDLRRRKEVGGLMHHTGSITHLHFPSRSHLLSASEDGTLCLFRARDWAVLRSLKGHKGRVNCVAVHPSGKVALSVGKDRTLRMWDLMRGKGSASTKLGKEAEVVRWSVSGSQFVVQSQSTMDVYSTDMALLYTITHPSRLHDVRFFKPPKAADELLLAAAEDHKTTVYDIAIVPRIVAEMVGHENRVKAIETISISLPPPASSLSHSSMTTTLACTVSSDGKIHVYDLGTLYDLSQTSDKPQQLEPVATYDTKGTRLTCMTVAEGDATAGAENRKGEKHHEPGEDAEESEGEEWLPQPDDEAGSEEGSGSEDSGDA